MAKRTITVRGVPDATLRVLRQRAAAERRSLNAELLGILDSAPAERRTGAYAATPAPSRQLAPKRKLADPGIDAITAFCRRHHIQWLAVFGSSARGEATGESDVDVVVEFEPGHTPGFGIVTVAALLTELFHGKRVDLVTLKGLSPRMRERVLSSARVLYDAR